ncbi:MAG: hypothetical protein ACMUIU_03810 [bacterium]
MINKNFRAIYYILWAFFILCLVFSNTFILNSQAAPTENKYNFLVYKNIEKFLTEPLKNEGCWECHPDMYPDMAYDPNDPNSPNCLCFMSPGNTPSPLFYSTYDPDPNLPRTSLSPEYLDKFREDYAERKKGHLSHLVYQPFGLGRTCLDCHDPNHYKLAVPADPNGHDNDKKVFIIYFKGHNNLKNTTLNNTKVCYECHGGFYPKGSEVLPEDPNIDPNSVRVLQWGDPGTVTCLQCHDDSYEDGGIYASYISRYCSFPNRFYDNNPNGCEITAPDPDKVPGQNYWPKSGHGVTAQNSYAGATLDTGYPYSNRQTYPNKGAMNNENIPIDPNYSNPHSHAHDLNLDPEDGRKNFCLECHWSNETVWEKVCVESLQAFDYPDGFPIGKYNGHLDTAKYRDERWGADERSYPDICLGHKQWNTCRECHPTKYSHFVYKEIGSGGRRKPGPIDRFSHCIVCHNPHGSGDEHGNVNVFMIKGRIYKQICNNCHYSQFRTTECELFADLHADPNRDTWVVNFFDPLKQDIREPDSSENSISIPTSTKDICEVCHQDKAREYWPNPGDPYGNSGYDYKHRNGSRHYFNPDNDTCPDSDSCTIDYRGTDCTGCHIHDPGPVPHPDDPDYDYETSDSRSVFNSRAFAPTCRCHGIGRIDIATFTVDGNQPDNSLSETLFGKGHGTPPPPFPVLDSSLTEEEDAHMAHTRYNFPCIACHIDPNGPLYDPNVEYEFVLDNYTPVSLDQYMKPYDQLMNPNNLFMNPNGTYEKDTRTCSNLYCHSNAKGGYADPISWSAVDKFIRDTNDPNCLDSYGRFKYCNECHMNPPDVPNPEDPNNLYNITDHIIGSSQTDPDIKCSDCHPHNGLYMEKINGIYMSNPEFYRHVNGKVDIGKIIFTFEPVGCGYCHKPDSPDLMFHDPNVSVDPNVLVNEPIEYDFPRDSCLYCHSIEHKEMKLCDPNMTDPDIDLQCIWCHLETLNDPEPDFGCDSDKKWLHSADAECTSCHSAVCDPNTIHHYNYQGTLPLSIEEKWNDVTSGCGACHHEEYLSDTSEKTSFRNAKVLHDKISPSTSCSECHGEHCTLEIDDISDCKECHIPQDDIKVGQNFLHDRYTGLDDCEYCHFKAHETEEMAFTEGTTQAEIEGKCIKCHNSNDLKSINVSCGRSGNHDTRANCLNCHKIYTIEDNIYKIKTGHYNMPTNLEGMEEAWSDVKPNDPAGNHCGVCHQDPQNPFDPSKKLHASITSACSVCHGAHCDMNILPGWTGDNTCGGCHVNGDVSLPGGQLLHSGLPPGVSCLECHPDHRDADSLRGYLDDPRKCGYCHGDPPAINVLCNGISVNGAHPPQATNCQTCHPGVYNKAAHYKNAGPVNVIQAWEGPNSCGICHSDLPVALCAAGPFSIHATLGPASDCSQCHGNHCDMNYGNTPAKCIACHSPNPAICDICGPGSITSHYAFDSMGVNHAAIQDCLSCHVEPLGGGEANPLEHIDNPRTFVKEGACLGCHSLSIIRHGATDPRGCYTCHPMHCVTEYARNDACIWCHTTNPPIVDICKMGIGITSHLTFDSSVFNLIQITNCIGCHVEPITGGEANPINHIDNPMTYVNPLTCLGCHTVPGPLDILTNYPLRAVPHGGSGLPWGGGVWPAVNCYSCHPTHCISTYCENQACVWCHTDVPLLKNVCGRPGLTPHTGDCVNCHVAGSPTGGECNPADHMNAPTYVRDGTCLGCHASVIATHGPGTEACVLCHPVHCSFTYCSEPQCKLCHNQPAFEIVSDYGCGIGLHDPPAYRECNRCHAGECNPMNHTLGPADRRGMPTDLSGMRLEWRDCGLCHSEAQAYHAPCNAPCTLCHSGTSNHACLNLDYCAENKCKCCHASPTFPINSDYGCGVGQHAAGAYVNCSLCHSNECNALNHMDKITDVSNMPLDWQTCGLCHMDAQAIHQKCNQPCTACHSGTGNHACLDLNYCAEPKCKCCHADPVFPINSDYGCGTGPHSAQAYIDCTMCHIQECNVNNHIDGLTDVSNMLLDWPTCGLCHADAQASHVNCPEPCTLCHSGTGNHSCAQLDYCAEIKCKCCHLDTIFINSDYGCGSGPHLTAAYVDCTMCHIGECAPLSHMDTMTDVSNMPLTWPACGLCHVDAQTIHVNCPEPCTLCHTGTSNHSCLELDYCAETKCKCCHDQATFPINSDYGCGTGTHAATAYVDCAMCHVGECTVGNHLDTTTDVSNMPLTWASCGLCHADAQASHANCPETCTMCHSGTSPHACLQLDYCADQKCRCCHINVPYHFNTPCDCSTCHSAECDPIEHDITGVSTSHPMDPLYYNYTGTVNDKGCTCCHAYPPQCVCVGISDTQDHCLDLVNGCSPQIYDCLPCHTLFNGQPNHIYTVYGTPAAIASCACHGNSLGTTGAHSKHLTTPVMAPVYATSTGNVIDCQACHSATTNLADHVICIPGTGVTAPVQFDAALPMIGLIDSYTPGATPGTGSCNLYCHSDGDEDPLDVPGTYIYFLGAPPFWNQTTGIISCGNAVLGTTASPIYQCHGYPPPPPGHPGGAGGGGGLGIQNCAACHPTPILGTVPDNTFHINGAVEVGGGGGLGGGGGGLGGGGGGGLGGGIPVI